MEKLAWINNLDHVSRQQNPIMRQKHGSYTKPELWRPDAKPRRYASSRGI
ncbi:MAG: hypothetical protein GFH27_549287n212 [Chloroflexi bacterium AL-W]|nr:hypothetical protein [Chloroflexi bacterium AL-N1]NOK66486.1 hypothetical protein [Chloroflexi bacterium AL-N10]NOK71874.1 hypothetical protein [Chloroflexi bacterium AL-N5]NOK81131.1 hypothetical protein [Chloroflexi bacterium AL-W]NOK89404.1 hypothetical protein [Chloroflexi bacterium AL-N15]